MKPVRYPLQVEATNMRGQIARLKKMATVTVAMPVSSQCLCWIIADTFLTAFDSGQQAIVVRVLGLTVDLNVVAIVVDLDEF